MTNFPKSQPLVKDCQFGVSPVNSTESDTEIVTTVECVKTRRFKGQGCGDKEQSYARQWYDFDNIHSSGSQNSLENGQKIDISRRKYETEREKTDY